MSRASPTLRERVSAAILVAAAEVLAERGERASMSDVAEAAGVARGTLYRYFPTREALLEAIAGHAIDASQSRLQAARLDEVPVGEAFARAVRALVAVGDAFVVLARERDRTGHAAFDRQVATVLARLIERARAEDQLRDDVPATWLLEALLALAVTVVVSAPALGPEDTVDAITSLFLDGARKSPTSAPGDR